MEITGLAYFDELISILEQNLPYDSDLALEQITTHRSAINNSILIWLAADQYSLEKAMHGFKTECCGLLLRSLQLKTAVRLNRPDLERLHKEIVVVTLIQSLEDLYHLYKHLEHEAPKKD